MLTGLLRSSRSHQRAAEVALQAKEAHVSIRRTLHCTVGVSIRWDTTTLRSTARRAGTAEAWTVAWQRGRRKMRGREGAGDELDGGRRRVTGYCGVKYFLSSTFYW